MRLIPKDNKRERIQGSENGAVGEPESVIASPDYFYSRLETDLSEPFVVGEGNILYLQGWCYHTQVRIKQLYITADDDLVEITNHSSFRDDVFDQQAPFDPLGNSLLSGFVAHIPFKAVNQPKEVDLFLTAVLDGGKRFDLPLGRVHLLPGYDGAEQKLSNISAFSEPLVVICMATFNPDIELFENQINSLINQSHKNWICIITDDCSSPDTYEEMKRVTSKDARFYVYQNESNIGLYKNFEKSLTYVPKGADFVAFSDQDDEWYPNKLERCLAEFKSEKDQLVYSDMDIVDRTGKIISHSYWVYRKNNYTSLESLFFANTVTGAASVFRASLLKYLLPFPKEYPNAFHDHWVACVALSMGTIRYIDEPIYAYTQHGNNVYGLQRVEEVRLFPEGKRLKDWFRYPQQMKNEMRETLRQLDDAYVRYLLRLVLLAKTILLRLPDIDKQKLNVLRQIARFDQSVLSLLYQGFLYKLRKRPTLGGEWLALRSFIGHYLLYQYYSDSRKRLRS